MAGRITLLCAAALLFTACGANYSASSNLPPAAASGGGSAGGGSGSSGATGSCGTDNWNNYAAAFFANNCETCHQHTTEFSSEAAVLAKAAAIQSYVDQGLMPQGAPLAQADRSRLDAWLACPDGTALTTTGGTTTGGTTSSSGSTGTCSTLTWSDVQGLFATYCTSCHSAGGSASAYVDLTSQTAATNDAANIYSYVNAGLMPKAGSPQLPAADKSTILSWASNPSGQCGGSSGSTGGGSSGATTAGSLGVETACVSATWGSAPSQPEGGGMNPGDNCMQCHQANGSASGLDKRWDFAGTLYDSPNGGNPVYDATITVVDATGATATAYTYQGENGNFYHLPNWGSAPVTNPLSITITKGSQTQWMLHTAPNGSCNSCHTASGQCNAPGRIHLP